jgi:hypothetical protein
MQTKRTSLEPGLDITIHAYDLPVQGSALPLWTLITNGLSAFGQREVVFTIVRRGATARAFPDGVVGYIPALKHFASQGRLVDDGGLSGYRAPGPFGLGSFVGVAFMNAPAIPGMSLPEAALAGIFLTEGELSMASTCSVRRVLHRLGKAARYFPTPHWSDPSRQSVYTVEDAAKSLLCKLERETVPHAAATIRGDVMHLTLPSSFATTLADRIEGRVVSAILPTLEPGVSAALVWSPGQTEPEAICADGPAPTAIAGTFVALIPNDAEDDVVRFMEDGCVVVLSTQSAQRLVASLRTATAVELRGEHRALRITVSRNH